MISVGRDGAMRYIFDGYSVIVDEGWQISDTGNLASQYYGEYIDLYDGDSEIRLRARPIGRHLSPSGEQDVIKSVANAICPMGATERVGTFHGLKALTMTHTSRGSRLLLNIPLNERISEDITLFAWGSYYMTMVSAYPAGDVSKKRKIDKAIAGFSVTVQDPWNPAKMN